jgi:hypothetical protein
MPDMTWFVFFTFLAGGASVALMNEDYAKWLGKRIVRITRSK